MTLRCCVFVALVAVPIVAPATVFPFEVLGSSADWVVIRENITATSEDTAACTYPGLDASEYVGAKVHFLRLSAEARRGRMVFPIKPDVSLPLYSPARGGQSCTSTTIADQRWKEIVARAKSLGIGLSSSRIAAVLLGDAVPARACVLMGSGDQCRRVFKQALDDAAIRIAVSLTAVPEAPDETSCQFVGYRFGAVIQVAGPNLGTVESGVAPGGFADHYDCRSQQFDPLRLYHLDRFVVLLGGFRGTNIADRDEYPFLLVFPDRP